MADWLNTLGGALFEAAPDPILLVGGKGEILALNKQAERCFGYTREELVSKPIETLLPESMRERHLSHRDEYHQSPHVRPMGSGLQLYGQRKDGSIFPVEISLSPLETERGRIIISIVRDVTERRAQEAKLRYVSTHDALTGLYNRAFFEEKILQLEAEHQGPIGVIAVDVDGLKSANDTLGHSAGDILLQRTAKVLHETFRADDVVARTGGDEFVVLLPGPCDEQEVLERLRASLLRHNEESTTPLSFAVGFAFASGIEKIPQALREADAKMYQDKRTRGKSRE